MFRSKSFNNRHVSPNLLTRSKSISDIYVTALDARALITVKKVGAVEAVNLINRILTKNMTEKDWGRDNFHDPSDIESNKFLSRYEDARFMFEQIKDIITMNMRIGKSNDNKCFFIAFYSGVPIGALQLRLEDIYASESSFSNNSISDLPEVELLATHCGINNAGVILVEHAVNESQKSGKEGKLKCFIYDAAYEAYSNMGFYEITNEKNKKGKRCKKCMYLDPSKSSLWHFINGHYKYKGF
ncbi:N-acetyltransferase [Xenorhabdus mauleonii]|uniref:N-acetyltransferase n=1 Tax=Xenorhabdus mauleonii TaxID=351675 RepID=A0A1I3J3X8_9GAMM|nr:hypothetical protein [Xenorhabdus mauleonii]PHM46085.1 N-acetyltransferase [Xenorhabdus mauleonii]SFI54879.1 hypothetical protein SAMN05421680_10276 [Xenorhabdus mauleonii]